MTDVTTETKTLETKPELTPEQKAQQEEQAKQQAEMQRQIQMMEQGIVNGKRALTLTCINLAQLTINTLPRPDQDEEAPKSKKNPQKRLLTISDIDKVSTIVEQLTKAVANLSGGANPMGPMGMRGPMMR